MNHSLLKTVTLPNAVPGANPTVVGQGTQVPMRVVVRNTSATMVFVANASQDLVGPGGVGSSAYRIAPGDSEVFVVAPGQQLFAAANGVGAIAGVALSEALPLV